MKRRYRRIFVILEGEDQGYEAKKNQLPKGYAKIEISNGAGNLQLHCQNLKNVLKENKRYRWYLVNTNHTEPVVVDIGPMEVDSNGKGEVHWEFNGDNVRGTKEPIEAFSLLILAVEALNGPRELITPLVGHLDKEKRIWRRAVAKALYGQDMAATMPEETEVAEVAEVVEVAEGEAISAVPIEEDKAIPQEDLEHLDTLLDSIPTADPVEDQEQPQGIPVEESPVASAFSSEVAPEPTHEDAAEAIDPQEPIVVEGTLHREISEEQQETLEDPSEGEAMDRAEVAPEVQPEMQTETASLPTHEEAVQMEEPHSAHEVSPHITVEAPPAPRVEEVSAQAEAQEENYLLNESNMTKAMQAYIESNLKMFPKINPFEQGLPGYQWWHIYYNYQTIYRSHMPFIAYIDALKPQAPYYAYQYPSEYHRQIYPYQHYIFGIQYDHQGNGLSYVYGIPGRRTRVDQPYGGKTGFNYWHPCKANARDGAGYWLMHINPKDGKVIYPMPDTFPDTFPLG